MISFEKFCEILTFFGCREHMGVELNKIFKKYDYQVDFINGYGFIDDRANNYILQLLKDMFNDKSDWIEYWLYTLDHGILWKPGMITDVNGNDIKLETTEDLWNLLIENMIDGEL